MAPLLQYFLPALGICRHFPRKLVYGTCDHMGLNLLHLFTLQEIALVKDILFHSFNDTLTGLLYVSSLELLLLELGCNADYQWPPDLINKLSTASLIRNSWKFLFTHGIVLKHDITLSPLRKRDQFIMEAYLSLDIPEAELVACNHCKMYLWALYLSDITNGDGLYVSDSAWNGNSEITPYKRRSWPHYGKPNRASWELWRKWVKVAFLGRGRRLEAPLGDWLQGDANWPWYLAVDGGLLQYEDGQWFSHAPIIKRNRLPSFTSKRHACITPTAPQRATVFFKGDCIVFTGAAPIFKLEVPPPATFCDFLAQDTDLQWCHLYTG
jgi:hypothetical protein